MAKKYYEEKETRTFPKHEHDELEERRWIDKISQLPEITIEPPPE
jgi:hypothetical protein